MRKLIIKTGLWTFLWMAHSPATDMMAQKRPLDVEACLTWQRVESPDVSPTGRWVTYRIASMESTPHYKDDKTLHLFDTRTRKEFLLPDLYNVQFYDQDRGLYYDTTDSAGVTTTVLMSLPSGEKKKWKYEEPFNPVKGTPYSISMVQVDQDTLRHIPAFNRLVVRHLKTGKAVYIDSVGHYALYDKGRSIFFLRQCPQGKGNRLCYGPLGGPYKTLYQSDIRKQPMSFDFNAEKQAGTFNVKDSLWFTFSLRDKRCRLDFDVAEIQVPAGMKISRISLGRKNRNYVTFECYPASGTKRPKLAKDAKPEKDFELELWTWDELEVPTLQHQNTYVSNAYPQYLYDRRTGKQTEIAPAFTQLYMPEADENLHYALYTDESPYKPMREWYYELPFDVYAVNLHTGEKKRIGEKYRHAPKWSPNGRWALMYDPIAQVWNKFDSQTGELTDVSTAIGYPVYEETHDKPLPAPAYGLAGWTADGNNAFIYDAYDWWKIDLTGRKAPECFTKGYGRTHRAVIRKAVSNMDVDIFQPTDKLMATVWDTESMETQLYSLNMKGSLKQLTKGSYDYSIHRFSDNGQYCVWQRQNVSEFRDLWWSKADFSNPIRITTLNTQQKDYLWGTVETVEWTNYENKRNKGLLYLPEGYDPKKEYPVIVQFYETHTEGKNIYPAPILSSAMGEVMYLVSHGYIVFMPDVHFTVGNPGKSSYDAVVSGTNFLIEKGIAHPGKIGLQGHSWSGYQTAYLVTKTDMFACANICAPITDMVTGYLGIRDGSGLPRYFMYEEWQSRMGKSLWEAKESYLANSSIMEADKIHTPLLILHNDKDEAVAYEQGRALYLAMRRLQRPAWLLNYKGEGHFVTNQEAQKDWTIRMMQFFDYYLKGTKEPRWMKEGIHLSERGIDNKYDLLNE